MWIPAFFLEGPEAHAARGGDGRDSHGDRYLGMTDAMTQAPVPTASTAINWEIRFICFIIVVIWLVFFAKIRIFFRLSKLFCVLFGD